MLDNFVKLLSKHWWAQGVIAIIALASMAEPLVELGDNWILDFLRSLIFSWDATMDSIGRVISKYVAPKIAIGTLTLNTVIVCFSTVVPFSYHIARGVNAGNSRINVGRLIPRIIAVLLCVASIGVIYHVLNAEQDKLKSKYYDDLTHTSIDYGTSDVEKMASVDKCLEENNQSIGCFGIRPGFPDLAHEDRDIARSMQKDIFDTHIIEIYKDSYIKHDRTTDERGTVEITSTVGAEYAGEIRETIDTNGSRSSNVSSRKVDPSMLMDLQDKHGYDRNTSTGNTEVPLVIERTKSGGMERQTITKGDGITTSMISVKSYVFYYTYYHKLLVLVGALSFVFACFISKGYRRGVIAALVGIAAVAFITATPQIKCEIENINSGTENRDCTVDRKNKS